MYNSREKVGGRLDFMQAAEHLAISIGGGAVTARAVRLRDLIELLSDWERALMATAGASNYLRKQNPADFYISLVDLDAELAKLHLNASTKIQNAANRIAAAINRHSSVDL